MPRKPKLPPWDTPARHLRRVEGAAEYLRSLGWDESAVEALLCWPDKPTCRYYGLPLDDEVDELSEEFVG